MVAPRRRVRGLEFIEVDPRDRRRVLARVREADPTVIVHLGVYEPDAWSSPRLAQERTSANALSVLGAAAELSALEHIVLRSGLEVYGRSRGSASVPDESVPPHPTSSFGRSLLQVERLAAGAADAADVPMTVLRLAPVIGRRVPTPLSRYLRLPVVPVSAVSDPAFTAIDVDDAARALVAALTTMPDATVNVVASGAVTVWQAARLGRRLPVPLVGAEWWLAARIAELAGAPLPEHLVELVQRGRAADGTRAAEVLGFVATRSVREAVTAVQSAEPVALRVVEDEAA
jgi:UDP-glucose 4-epimerase